VSLDAASSSTTYSSNTVTFGRIRRHIWPARGGIVAAGRGGGESAYPVSESGNMVHCRLLYLMMFAQVRGQIARLLYVLE
jgi:hypothetical protein